MRAWALRCDESKIVYPTKVGGVSRSKGDAELAISFTANAANAGVKCWDCPPDTAADDLAAAMSRRRERRRGRAFLRASPAEGIRVIRAGPSRSARAERRRT